MHETSIKIQSCLLCFLLPLRCEALQAGRVYRREDLARLSTAVGLGTTQLYNRTLVYNHKRHSVFKLGNRQFDFRMKPRFPKKLTPDFLYVDLLNNLQELAEDRDAVLLQARSKLPSFDPAQLQRVADRFGNLATRKRLREWSTG
jgi:hypothetical protein